MLKPEDRMFRMLTLKDPDSLKAIDCILLGKDWAKEPSAHPLDDRIHSISGAAKILGLCRKSVYNMIRDGHLKAVRVGNRYRISGRTIREFISK